MTVVSDQGALGKLNVYVMPIIIRPNHNIINKCFTAAENIMTQHPYTSTEVKTAAAAVNAGTCLEDGNSQDNILSNIRNAVKTVNLSSILTNTCSV